MIFSPYLYGPVVFVLWIIVLWLIKRFFIYRLRRWAQKTVTIWDDILVQSVSIPLNLLIFASGLAILAYCLPFPDKVDAFAAVLFQGSIIFSIVLFLDGFLVGMMKKRATAFFGKTSQGLTQGICRGVVVGIGILTFLNLIGISITPILASLGIGSLAVALALQDTLSNFFAGLYAAIDKPIKVGDFIRLETGEEGTVLDVGWRSSKIHLPANNVVIIPNSKLMGSVITNYSLPQPEVIAVLTLNVDYSSDLRHVEQVTMEVAQALMRSAKEAVPGFDPVVRFGRFADSGIEVNIAIRARQYTDSFIIKHDLIKALHERYKKEGIIIPSFVRQTTFQGRRG